MTNTPPPDPESSSKNPLGFDEFIAVLVAFSTIGVILFWSLSRKDSDWNVGEIFSLSPATSPNIQQNPGLPSPVPQVQPNTETETVPSPVPTPNVESSTAPLTSDEVPSTSVLPPIAIAPVTPAQVQAPLSASKPLTPPFSLVTPAKKKSAIPPPIAFNDVPDDFWGRKFINVLSARGTIKGFPDYTFRPNQPVTRAEFAAILQQAFEEKPVDNPPKFKDIQDKFWAIPAINQAISTGFLKGYPNQTFQPEQKISRVQVLVALVSGLNLKTPASPEQVLKIYKDAKDIPQYATDKVASATANGLVVNYPNLEVFAPNQEATRAEVAAMVHQALVYRGRLEAIPSNNIVRLPK
ncbi:S-layer homology domain-containing protein [Calothrix sp. FACHB-1219]|uniref:S-layer homology domain-containing protein n=1 Tax=unclassified Calothrix TaxID=2619626 RepID=UPI0016831A47|nr:MULTISPECIES: S-layer homology domain-containing protein [unclassified Calothrix]MBD2205049.1 S-layer homology domain-containing protein [Calothrix sp. FACHB-168]MBD2219847.1 S-layer homology domain-containing protein [Calothrix sp. FACHB-1219]